MPAGGDERVMQSEILGLPDPPLEQGFAANVVNEGLGLLQQQDLKARARQHGRQGRAGDAAPDDYNVIGLFGLRHVAPQPPRRRWYSLGQVF